MNTFTRGLDPKRAMGIGITTWENLQEGDILYVKKFINISQTNDNINIFARDRRPGVWGLNMPANHYLHIKDITRVYKTRKEKIYVINLIIQYVIYLYLDDIKNIGPSVNRTFILRGPVEQFKKYFEIIQHTRI